MSGTSPAKKDMESVQQIKFVRYPFPGYEMPAGFLVGTAAVAPNAAAAVAPSTAATVVPNVVILGTAVSSALFLGPVAGAVGIGVMKNMRKNAGDRLQAAYNLPDFTELLHKDLHEKLSPSFPNPSKLVFDGKPIDGEFRKTSDGLLTIEAIVLIEDGIGVRTDATVEMTDSMNKVLWKKRYWYNSSDFSRTSDLKSLAADGGKKLHEELAYAARMTVNDFIAHFEGKDDTGEAKEAQKK
jgi:hypothetical protein